MAFDSTGNLGKKSAVYFQRIRSKEKASLCASKRTSWLKQQLFLLVSEDDCFDSRPRHRLSWPQYYAVLPGKYQDSRFSQAMTSCLQVHLSIHCHLVVLRYVGINWITNKTITHTGRTTKELRLDSGLQVRNFLSSTMSTVSRPILDPAGIPVSGYRRLFLRG